MDLKRKYAYEHEKRSRRSTSSTSSTGSDNVVQTLLQLYPDPEKDSNSVAFQSEVVPPTPSVPPAQTLPQEQATDSHSALCSVERPSSYESWSGSSDVTIASSTGASQFEISDSLPRVFDTELYQEWSIDSQSTGESIQSSKLARLSDAALSQSSSVYQLQIDTAVPPKQQQPTSIQVPQCSALSSPKDPKRIFDSGNTSARSSTGVDEQPEKQYSEDPIGLDKLLEKFVGTQFTQFETKFMTKFMKQLDDKNKVFDEHLGKKLEEFRRELPAASRSYYYPYSVDRKEPARSNTRLLSSATPEILELQTFNFQQRSASKSINFEGQPSSVLPPSAYQSPYSSSRAFSLLANKIPKVRLSFGTHPQLHEDPFTSQAVVAPKPSNFVALPFRELYAGKNRAEQFNNSSTYHSPYSTGSNSSYYHSPYSTDINSAPYQSPYSTESNSSTNQSPYSTKPKASDYQSPNLAITNLSKNPDLFFESQSSATNSIPTFSEQASSSSAIQPPTVLISTQPSGEPVIPLGFELPVVLSPPPPPTTSQLPLSTVSEDLATHTEREPSITSYLPEDPETSTVSAVPVLAIQIDSPERTISPQVPALRINKASAEVSSFALLQVPTPKINKHLSRVRSPAPRGSNRRASQRLQAVALQKMQQDTTHQHRQDASDKAYSTENQTMSPSTSTPVTNDSVKRSSGGSSKSGSKKQKKVTPNPYDDVSSLLENPDSPIYDEDLAIKHVIMGMKARMEGDRVAAEKAKAILEHQKKLIIDGANAIMPELTALAKIAFEHSPAYKDSSIYNNLTSDEINSDFARFQENGRAGRYDPEWQRQALAASERRAAGDMDEYQDAQFKEQWGESSETLSDDGSDATYVDSDDSGNKSSDYHMASGGSRADIQRHTGQVNTAESVISSADLEGASDNTA